MKRVRTFVITAYTVCAVGFTQCSTDKNKETTMVTFTDHSIQSQFAAKPHESINFKQAEAHFKKHPERWNTAFKFLSETNLEQLEVGRIDLSEDVFALVTEYETKNLDEAKFESHQERIDLQYLISGKELIGLTNDTTMQVISPYSKEKDITFYEYDGGEMLSASSANYFIFFPNDKHKPNIDSDGKNRVKKIVIKIRYPD
jgi:YhcH/YjgK/YiaL family protein